MRVAGLGWGNRSAIKDGKIQPVPQEQWKSLRAEEQFDALLYLGPEDAMTQSMWSPSLCSDAAYMNTRLKRIALSGIPPAEAERLKKYCAEVASK